MKKQDENIQERKFWGPFSRDVKYKMPPRAVGEGARAEERKKQKRKGKDRVTQSSGA